MGTIIEDVAAAKWVAIALSSSGYKADFTPSSLWEIDRFFDDHARILRGRIESQLNSHFHLS